MDATRSPGWYPAPDGNGQQWWNGAGWSESRQGAAGAAAPPVAPTPARASAPAATAPAATAPVAPPAQRIVYSASNPAPQYPGQTRGTLDSQIPAAMRIDARANPAAVYALVAGIGAVVFNVLLVPSILAIVFGARALNRAKQLTAAGETNTMRGLAVVGLALGVFGGAIGLLQAGIFVFSIIASIVSAVSGAAVS